MFEKAHMKSSLLDRTRVYDGAGTSIGRREGMDTTKYATTGSTCQLYDITDTIYMSMTTDFLITDFLIAGFLT